MTVYYNANQPVSMSLITLKGTSLQIVFKKKEFWMFVALHCVLAFTFTAGLVDTTAVGELPWESAATVQFFMTFFLTFYSQHCGRRYHLLYDKCMGMIDNVLLFVHELTVTHYHPELEKHRTVATKYVLAAMYIFLQGLTSGELARRDWRDLVHKGLLTKVEMEALANYPGGEVTMVLCNWALQVVDDGLSRNCHWQPRMERIAHPHNRMNNFIVGLLADSSDIATIVALPIPFPYYHLMNLVLVLNFFLIACVLALFKTPFTIVPFAIIVAIFMGLREVATQLADPFGEDEVDFPIHDFIQYAIDTAIVMLESFNKMDRESMQRAIDISNGFTEEQLRRPMDKGLLYERSGRELNTLFQWQQAPPLTEMPPEDDSVLFRLHTLLRPKMRDLLALKENQDEQTDWLAQLAKVREEKEELQKQLVLVVEEIKLLSNADHTPHLSTSELQSLPAPPVPGSTAAIVAEELARQAAEAPSSKRSRAAVAARHIVPSPSLGSISRTASNAALPTSSDRDEAIAAPCSLVGPSASVALSASSRSSSMAQLNAPAALTNTPAASSAAGQLPAPDPGSAQAAGGDGATGNASMAGSATPQAPPSIAGSSTHSPSGYTGRNVCGDEEPAQAAPSGTGSSSHAQSRKVGQSAGTDDEPVPGNFLPLTSAISTATGMSGFTTASGNSNASFEAARANIRRALDAARSQPEPRTSSEDGRERRPPSRSSSRRVPTSEGSERRRSPSRGSSVRGGSRSASKIASGNGPGNRTKESSEAMSEPEAELTI